ncbi:MAG: MHYT domain-containing protein [Sphingobium sp.]
MIITGLHNDLLVCLSILIAAFASYTALDLANRVRASTGWVRDFWLCTASIAMGGGIWSMHFVAMLAFHMPGMTFGFDPLLTVISLLFAIFFTGVGFAVMNRWQTLGLAGVLMGLGVVAMHYLGMAAMRMPAHIRYEPLWVALSLMIAIGAATASLWLASRDQRAWPQIGAATLMGLAVSGMHYAGMRGAVFTARHDHAMPMGSGVSAGGLIVAVTAFTFLILFLSLAASMIDRRFSIMRRREARNTLRLQLADVMRDTGTSEALQRAAALMGAHFGVSRVGYGQFDPVDEFFDYDICWTDGSASPLLGRYPTEAFGTKIVAQLNKGRTVVVDDVMAAALSDEARTRDTAAQVDTRGILVVPFLRAGRLRTIVYLNSRTPRAWTPDEVLFMEEVAERTRQVIARAEVEEELRELNATLEARVAERTDELRRTEAALRQSQKMEAIGQLTGGIAHDFNNMLMGVTGGLDIVRRRIKSNRLDDIDRFMDSAMASAQRAAALTARLLAFARRQSLDSRPTDINLILLSLADLLVRTMGEQIKVVVSGGSVPPAVVDANQLESAIINLAINARDAMQGGGTLTVATHRHEGNYVVVEVSDTGHGMDEATLEKAFDPFFTTKPIGQGTGLGLSMVYGFAEQSGGYVRIESRPDIGTSVRIFLPASDAPIAQQAEEARPVEQGDGQSVLLVEDDDAVRMLVREVLEELGYRPSVATESDGAIALLEAGRRFDLLITDFGLPGRNGRQLAEIARGFIPDLPVLFITGYAAAAADRAGFLEPGMHLIAKPFQLDVISAKIKEMLG